MSVASGCGLERAAEVLALLERAAGARFDVAAVVVCVGAFTGRGGLNWGPPRRDAPDGAFLGGIVIRLC